MEVAAGRGGGALIPCLTKDDCFFSIQNSVVSCSLKSVAMIVRGEVMSDAKEKYDRALSEANSDSPDISLVLELLNESMDEGCSDSAYALATWYLFGNHVEKDWNKAAFLLKKASRDKHPSALYDLAVCYEEGKGVKQDEGEAFRLYLQAALRGDRQSFHEVGRCYYYGIGVDEDKTLADIWLERAEELGVD
ncbi:Putative secreted protein with protein prenylyltransferase domain [Alloalcanivorax dieselolei B5]|uniref:Putative secreted protein with protein prenylyltransferase domain n=2 Tax=Alloalcanivorax dieselolei TaxID=285091 RepID=K0CBH7_ALCDB|nr:Putative secreted protein with protein prenylyltransferase domain [Alloalcanivorax dieselolei B5]